MAVELDWFFDEFGQPTQTLRRGDGPITFDVGRRSSVTALFAASERRSRLVRAVLLAASLLIAAVGLVSWGTLR
jgi:hypothetical protein